MTGKNLYDILGVPRNATPEQIRKAYLLRSKVLHPDRFDQTHQPTEWQLANEMVKDLNNAYSILYDSLERADYDRAFFGQSKTENSQPKQSSTNQSHQQTRRPPPQNVKLGKLKSGKANFNSLPRSTQECIKKRVTGEDKQQFGIKLSSVGGNYLLVAIFLAWFWFLFYVADDSRWDSETFGWLVGVTGVVALLQGLNVRHILNWHYSPIRAWLFITPLYVIKTHWNEVLFWPIWDITEIKATHNHRNGSYQDTSLHMGFKTGSEDFKISPESAYDNLLKTLRIFDQKIQSAKQQEDWSYFFHEDDFREFDQETAPPSPSSIGRTAKILGGSFFIYAVVFLIAYGINNNRPAYATNLHPPENSTPAPSSSEPSKPFVAPVAERVISPPPFSEPELELPANGETVAYTDGERVAPFEIKSSYGSDYVVKLADYLSGQTVMTVFVRGGETVNVHVPLGNFAVKYATGSKWYGYKYLFGPETGYSVANDPFTFRVYGDQVEGFTITLYKVPNGNLRTQKIKPEEF